MLHLVLKPALLNRTFIYLNVSKHQWMDFDWFVFAAQISGKDSCTSQRKLTDPNEDAATLIHSFYFRFLFTQHNVIFLLRIASISSCCFKVKTACWDRLAIQWPAARGCTKLNRHRLPVLCLHLINFSLGQYVQSRAL